MNFAADEKRLSAALDFHRQNRFGEAESIYRNILADDPNQPDALHWLGLIAYQSGNCEAAIKLMQKSVANDPQNALAHIDLGNAYLTMGRQLDGEEAFRIALDLDENIAAGWCNLGSALKAQGKLDEAEVAYMKALALDEKLADALANLGGVQVELGRPEEAKDSCLKAIEYDPSSACAYANLAAALIGEDELDEAVNCARQAIEIDVNFSTAHQNLGEALKYLGQFEEGSVAFRQAIALNPKNVIAFVGLANVQFGLGLIDEAKETLRRALKVDRTYTEAILTLGHISLWEKDISGFWEAYSHRWNSAKHKSFGRRYFSPPKWGGEQLDGKSLLVWGEQGIGDEILFAGLMPEISNVVSNCVMEAAPRIVPLFARSFPNVQVVPRDDPPHPRTSSIPFDYQTPSGDLLRWLRPEFEGFRPLGGYLKACPEKVAEIRARYQALGDGVIVGISWHSAPAKRVTLDKWSEILSVPGIQFVSLQYGDRRDEIDCANDTHNTTIYFDPLVDPLDDMDTFAAQVAAVDVVVTIDNSTLAVAAALDIPTFALIPILCDWRYLSDDRTNIWHECLRQYQQTKSDDWSEAISQMAIDFREYTATVEQK